MAGIGGKSDVPEMPLPNGQQAGNLEEFVNAYSTDRTCRIDVSVPIYMQYTCFMMQRSGSVVNVGSTWLALVRSTASTLSLHLWYSYGQAVCGLIIV